MPTFKKLKVKTQKVKENTEKPRIILGIDPGYGKCGWAILEKSRLMAYGLKLVSCGCIETKNNKSLAERLGIIYQEIEDKIKKYNPQELAIESLFFFKNQKTALAVAQARGAIIVCGQNHHLEIFEYTPLQVKQAIVGYGRGDKEQIQKMIKLHLRGQKTPLQDDTADAVAIALTHVNSSRMEQSLTITKKSQIVKQEKANTGLIHPDLSFQIIGILFKIYNELGGGYQEKYYYKPIEVEFRKAHIDFVRQSVVDLRYKDLSLGRYLIDYVVDRKIVLEIKVTPYFSKRDIKQVLAYLERSRIELGILASFTKQGVKTKRILRGFNN